MKYFPYEKYILDSKLSPETLFKRLHESIEPRKAIRWNIFDRTQSAQYEGDLNGNSFKINRVISYRNSFLPIVLGRIESDGSGSKVFIMMKMNAFVFVFWIFWMSAVSLASLFSLGSLAYGNFKGPELIPIGMFFFGYLMALIGFKWESSKAKEFVANLMEGVEINPK